MSKKQENNETILKSLFNFLLECFIRVFIPYVIMIVIIFAYKSCFAEANNNLQSLENIPRVSVQTYTQGTVMPIYLTPGKSSVIDFPCQVTKASQGTGEDIHAVLATSINNEVDLFLNSSASQTTSLIVRCKEVVFVFDIVPTHKTHQEYIKIKKSIGAIKFRMKSSTENLEPKKVKQYDTQNLKKISSGKILNPTNSYKEDEK